VRVVTGDAISLLPIAARWGGGPLPQAVVEGLALTPPPSNLRSMVPLPTGFAGREEL